MCYTTDIEDVGVSSLCGNRFEVAYGRVATGKLPEYLLVNRTAICPTKYR